MNSTNAPGMPDAEPPVFDPSTLLQRARSGIHCRSLIEQLAADLPPEDQLIAAMLDDAAKTLDDNLFTNLLFAALAAGRAVDARVLVDGAALLPDPTYLALAATHCTGDVASALVEASKRKGLGWERDAAALLLAGLWCSRHEPATYPPELISRARMLARESRANFFAQVQLLALADVLDNNQIRSVVANEGHRLDALAADLRARYAEFPSLDVLEHIPEEPESVPAQGKTVRRAVARIGRNDPCHCGSGKKYKKCCFDKDQQRLRRSSDVPGVTVEELRANPEPYLSEDRLMSMRSHELARLDPGRVAPHLHPVLLNRLVLYGEYESVVRTFEITGVPDELEDHWYDAVEFATMDSRKEIVRSLLRLHGIEKAEDLERFPDLGIGQRLLMTDEKPCRTLQLIETTSRDALAHDTGHLQTDLAYALLEGGFPALGIVAARAAMPLADRVSSSILLDKVLRLVGRIAAGDATAFTGSKRLQGHPSIIRQRVGIKHRLLFSVKGESLEIIDLIERKELEKTIRNFVKASA